MALEGVAGRRTSAASVEYQILMVALLSLNFGILFFDRNALNFLMPFVKPDLHLTNTQVGLTASALSFSWAIATLVVGAASDRSGRRKVFLVGATIAFSLCSVLSGLANSFVMLLGARLLMGVADGGVAPISQSMTALTVAPERRGVAMGIMQNFGSNLFGSFFAPVLLVAFATAFGWHHAFFITGLPGLLSALLLWRFVREPEEEAKEVQPESLFVRLAAVLRYRNIVICGLISVLLVSYLVVCWAFMPLFLTSARRFDPQTMSWLMGALGISATVGSFVVSGLSDRIGRRPVMIAASFVGLVLPLAAIYYGGPAWILAGFFFVGWALNGLFPLFMGTVPSETVDHHHMATAIALVMCLGEIFGGVLSPTLAGWAADSYGLAAPLWIMAGLCVASGLLALGLHETAPLRLAKSRAAA
jgi:MFS transporter, ACS family, hexuronate transporter